MWIFLPNLVFYEMRFLFHKLDNNVDGQCLR